jgi:hypothetical protein
MGADSIYNDTILDTSKPITGKIHLEGHEFDYEVYLLPIIGDDKEKVEKDLIHRIGNRMQKGKHCLDIDEAVVSQNIENNEYSAIGFVKNHAHDDSASGTMQYYDWCESGKNQMWINDLCRITTDKQSASPIKVLLKVFELITKTHTKGLRYINLMVDNEDVEGSKVLIEIYKKYGFSIITKKNCFMDDPDNEYTLMHKPLDRTASKSKARRTRGQSKPRRKTVKFNEKTSRSKSKSI